MEKKDVAKVIVLGDQGVGKSCLLFRFINDEFNEYSQPTQGAAYLSKIFEYAPKCSITYQLWDTAGQEKYKSIASIYYRDSQVAICVYDITRKSSFQVLKTWVQELKNKGPKNVLIVVVGTKVDLTDQEEVPFSEAKAYATEIGAIFKLTSAKEGKGINELFVAIAEKLNESKEKRNINVRQTMRLNSTDDHEEVKKKRRCC